jgi:hypothetical protein
MLALKNEQKVINGPKIPQVISIENVLRAIVDDKSLILFNNIALAGRGGGGGGLGSSDILISRLGLTRKQYYSRISALLKTGLIRRENRQYEVTSFGMIIYDMLSVIGTAINYYWKLKAIDSIEIEHKLPIDERSKIINTLIDNEKIIKILMNRC